MLEAVAVLFGVAYIVLAIRQHRACWIAGGASTALYSVVFLQSGLPLQAGLQLLYVALSVYGWIQWRPDGGAPQRPGSWPWPRHGLALAAIAIATAISTTLLMRYGGSTAPLADSLGTWASVFATWLLARRYLETWLWWIAIDLGLAALFAHQGLVPTAALYLAYALLAIVGWREWRRAGNAGDDARLEAVISELGMHRPERTPLTGGLANRTIRLRDAGHDVVVRIAGVEASALGADGESEQAMHRLAAGIGLAPRILIARPAEGLLVTRHAAGRTLTVGDLHDVAMLRRIGAWIARLHAEEPPPSLKVVDFGERAAGYLSTMLAHDATSPARNIAALLARRRAALPSPVRLAPCHHDLHHRNFVDTPVGLLAIDWEYAGPGDPAADLASCIGCHGLGQGEIDVLLGGYGADGGTLYDRLEAQRWIFDCLWYGWNGAALAVGLAVDRVLQARLEARLSD
ncbi:MAG: nicotinamide riboside transporter PnuC [Steroidobacteraceae bacterium]